MKLLGRRDRWDDIGSFRNASPWHSDTEVRDAWYTGQGETPEAGDLTMLQSHPNYTALQLHNGIRWSPVVDSLGYVECTVPATTVPSGTTTTVTLAPVNLSGITIDGNTLTAARVGHWVWSMQGNFSRAQAAAQRFFIGVVADARVHRQTVGYQEDKVSVSTVQYMYTSHSPVYFQAYQNSGSSATFTGRVYGKWIGADGA